MHQLLTIIGSQYGDEGKGKFVDLLGSEFDYTVRYQGGDNAGHTIVFNKQKFALSLIPSGIFTSHAVIGPGVVVNVQKLLSEIDYLKKQSIDLNRLHVSDQCHVILDYHIELDCLHEKLLANEQIGTTKRGIGPCYADKCARLGIRICDLSNYSQLLSKIILSLKTKNALFQTFGCSLFDAEQLAQKYYNLGQKLLPYVTNTVKLLNQAYSTGAKILLESAQGLGLDLNYGTYPFVTSSHLIGGMSSGTGLAVTKFHAILGIMKAYCSRVGAGPFVSEIKDKKLEQQIRLKGNEFGTVTKRPRRIGWLDLAAVKHAILVSGITNLAISLIDVLDELETIQVCVGYQLKGIKIDSPPADVKLLQQCQPIYQQFSGWNQNWNQVRSRKDLCFELEVYLNFIEKFLNVPISYLSYGPDRKQTLIMQTRENKHD